ncbi:MAG: ImmA/IrrE family metallo-endopeptidase [Bacteroidota bacterium]
MKITDTKLNPRMITLARESRGLTQKELADMLKISAGKLCKVELDSQSLNEELEAQLSKILSYPPSFFYQEGEVLPMSLNFRRRVIVAQKLIMPIEAQINIYRLNIEIMLKEQILAKNIVLDIADYGSAGAIAKQLRKIWKMPKGRIENMTELLETKGILVVSSNFGTERVDSRTIITKTGHPVIVINSSMHGDRQRFSLSYELGHLIMHVYTQPGFKRNLGHEANLFAAEFLMPEEDIKKDFQGDITIPRLAELKRKWKVSMQALLYRASDLKFLTDNQKRYLLQQFNQLDIRRREPPEVDIAREKPVLLRNLISSYRTKQKMSLKAMAGFFNLTEEEFVERYS